MAAVDYFKYFTVIFTMSLLPYSLGMPVARSITDTLKMLDMSYGFDNSTLYWPGVPDPADRTFRLDTITRGVRNFNNQSVYLEANKFAAAEHGGTHIDAPSHFVPNGTSIGNLPLDQLMGPVVRIDIHKQATESAKTGTDYLMSKEDVLAWEKQHGEIANGSLVFVFTGYGKFWPDATKYMGFDGQNGMDLHFPAISEAAAKLFVERGVKAVGIDTLERLRLPPK